MLKSIYYQKLLYQYFSEFISLINVESVYDNILCFLLRIDMLNGFRMIWFVRKCVYNESYNEFIYTLIVWSIELGYIMTYICWVWNINIQIIGLIKRFVCEAICNEFLGWWLSLWKPCMGSLINIFYSYNYWWEFLWFWLSLESVTLWYKNVLIFFHLKW